MIDKDKIKSIVLTFFIQLVQLMLMGLSPLLVFFQLAYFQQVLTQLVLFQFLLILLAYFLQVFTQLVLFQFLVILLVYFRITWSQLVSFPMALVEIQFKLATYHLLFSIPFELPVDFTLMFLHRFMIKSFFQLNHNYLNNLQYQIQEFKGAPFYVLSLSLLL